MQKSAFVTGGTGFVGINLIKLLCDGGWQVHALHRASSDLSDLEDLAVNWVLGDLNDEASLRRIIPEGCDAFFQVAGDTALDKSGHARQWRVNVEGVTATAKAALARGVGRYVLTSSVSAWGMASGVISEETPQLGHRSPIHYDQSKYAGEREALKVAEKGLDVVIVNPAAVLGPYDRTSWARLLIKLKAGDVPACPGGVKNFCHVREVARGHINAALKGRVGERYLLAGECLPISALVAEACDLMGVPKVPRVLPAPLLKFAALLMAASSKLTGNPPRMTREEVLLTTKGGVDFRSDKAVAELDYQLVPMVVSLKDSYDWLVSEGLL